MSYLVCWSVSDKRFICKGFMIILFLPFFSSFSFSTLQFCTTYTFHLWSNRFTTIGSNWLCYLKFLYLKISQKSLLSLSPYLPCFVTPTDFLTLKTSLHVSLIIVGYFFNFVTNSICRNSWPSRLNHIAPDDPHFGAFLLFLAPARNYPYLTQYNH